MRNEVQNILNDFIEIKLKDRESFLKIKETLTRIGVPSKKSNILFQSCHILFKQDRYYIVHFKELFKLDGRPTDLSQEDIGRRNTIANLLEDWGLLTIVNPKKTETPCVSLEKIKILTFSEKNNWELQPKYRIGKFKHQRSSEINRDD